MRRSAAGLTLVVVLGLACGGAGAATTYLAAGCPGYGGMTQAMNGRISGCLQVGSLRPGQYTVALDQVLLASSESAAEKQKLARGHTRLRAPREPAVALRIVPASGRPGTRVTVTGRLAHPIRHRSAYPNFCWDGCANGLSYSGVAVRWLSARSFRAHLVVPAAPWIEGSPVRVVALRSGAYPISVQCVVEAAGCAVGASEGSADFGLRAPAGGPWWCPSAAGCARLEVNPGFARPAQVVHISGYAPLASIIGADQPFVFQAELSRGRPSGSEVTFRSRRGEVTARLGHGALAIRRPPSYGSLAAPVPLAEVSAGLDPLAGAPADPSLVAWCGEDSIGVSDAGVPSSVPTAAARATLAAMGFSTPSGESATTSCTAVVPLGGASFAAAFYVGFTQESGPPFYVVALVTHDGGASWAAVPVPSGSVPAGFGGFRVAGSTLEAVFSSRSPYRKSPFPILDSSHPLAETTSDGGVTWTQTPLGCPAAGPCLTLGAFTPENCAMTSEPQPLLRSSGTGSRWTQPALPDQVDACGEAELVATSPSTDLLVSSISPYPVLRSTDGGLNWVDIGLPALPGENFEAGIGALGFGPGPGGITVLPDGGLLLTGSRGYRGGWELLHPRARSWCAVVSPERSVQRAGQQSPITVIGDQLWWLSGSYGREPAVDQMAASSVAC